MKVRIRVVLLAMFALGASCVADALAGNIGINFRRSSGQTELLTGEVAGVVPQDFWNNSNGGQTGNTTNIVSPMSGVIVDEFFDPTPVTVSWTAQTTWNANNSGTPDAKLMSGYIDNTNTAAPTQVTVSNIPFANYDVIAYYGSDSNNRSGHVGIAGAGPGSFYLTNSAPFTSYSTNATPGTPVLSNYHRITGLSQSTFTLFNTRISNNTGLHGIQIVETAGPANPLRGPRQAIAHWSFDANSVDDLFSNDNNGTLSGEASYGAGQFGNALMLDGTRDFATIAAPTAVIKQTDAFAVSAWINSTEVNSEGTIISMGDHYGLWVNADGTLHFFEEYLPNGNSWLGLTTAPGVASEKVINDGLWHHIVAQKTDTQLEIYIDGVRAASAGATIPTILPVDYAALGTGFLFGAHGAGGTGSDFAGKIDEVWLFDHSLSQADINNLRMFNVPEPSSLILAAFGLATFAFGLRRRGR